MDRKRQLTAIDCEISEIEKLRSLLNSKRIFWDIHAAASIENAIFESVAKINQVYAMLFIVVAGLLHILQCNLIVESSLQNKFSNI